MAVRRVDVEEDIDLVDNINNVAVASLFSPNMWVRRPCGERARLTESDIPRSISLASPQVLAPANTLNIGSHQKREREPAAAHGEDSDLAYLEAVYQEGNEREHAEADLAQIEAIENEIVIAQETTRILQATLQEATGEVARLQAQNGSVKRLFAALGVCKDDFQIGDANDGPSRKRRMIDIGQRLVNNLNNPGLHDWNAPPLGPQPAAAAATEEHALCPVSAQLYPAETPAPAAVATARPIFTPAASFPAESQIAAAALTMSRGDPAIAMLSLLEKALAGRAPTSFQEDLLDPSLPRGPALVPVGDLGRRSSG